MNARGSENTRWRRYKIFTEKYRLLQNSLGWELINHALVLELFLKSLKSTFLAHSSRQIGLFFYSIFLLPDIYHFHHYLTVRTEPYRNYIFLEEKSGFSCTSVHIYSTTPDVAESRGTDKGSFKKLPAQDVEKPKKERKQRVSTEEGGVPPKKPRQWRGFKKKWSECSEFFLY